MTRSSGRAYLLLLAALLLAVPARTEAQQPLPELSLEDLMNLDAGRVFGASERVQPVTEAPASVSFVTAAEIARYGYRTLADILRGVRGMYVTDDRNFSYLGTRGFSRPGDYNSRILLLVNGHRVNDNVFGQAEIGAEFGMDPAMFERVEIIRGPASSLYGDSAFFAVVNVITRNGASLNGASLAVEGGSLGTRMTRASLGHRLANGVDFAVSGTYEASDGEKRLYFPAYDRPETNNGIAENLDGEKLGQLYGHFSFKDLTVTAAYGARERIVPTASFGTVFNYQTSREQTTDRHTLLDAEYARALGKGRVTFRADFDRFSYNGIYPFVNLNAPDGPPDVGHNDVIGSRWTVGGRFTYPLPGRQMLTFGAEFIDNFQQNQQLLFVDAPDDGFVINDSSTQHAVYVQDEIKLARWLIFNGGLRYDGLNKFTRVTPRAAVIVMPSSNQSFKYLYGVAFRAPTAYESNTFFFGPKVDELLPESIDTHEVVWERYTNDWLRTSVSAYWYSAERLMIQIPSDSFLLTTYVNESRVRAKGLDFEAQMRLIKGAQGFASYSLQNADRLDSNLPLPNSPKQTLKARISVPGPMRSTVSAEVLYVSTRGTNFETDPPYTMRTVPPFTLTNLTVIAPLPRSLELFGTARNLFNVKYSDPTSDTFQDSIPQNGITLRVGLRWKFGMN